MPTPSAMSNRMNELATINYLFSSKNITHIGIRGALLTLFFVSLLIHCDSPEPINTSSFSVEIDVTDSLDQTRNLQGFEFLLYSQKTQNSSVDTLFIGKTDSMGRIMSTISFNEAELSSPNKSRWKPNLNMRILLPDDSVLFTGQFPEISQTLKVDSREQRVVDVFDRIDAGFTRTRRFIAMGALADTAIVDELRKWANLYEEVYKDYSWNVCLFIRTRGCSSNSLRN